jgi:GNAT superfamily N-acetyltransferase
MLRPAEPGELAAILALDDAAGELFAEVGVVFPPEPAERSERAEYTRFGRAIADGRLHVAVEEGGLVGFAALGWVDAAPYLDQLSVHPAFMRRGIGAQLLAHAIAWAELTQRALWLTTYAHVPWNRPYYERFGFRTCAPESVGRELAAILASQRVVLPAPEQRIAMVRLPASP